MPQNVLVSVLGEGEYLQKLIRAILEKEVVPQRNLFLSAKNAAACKAAEGYDEVRICEDELAAMIKRLCCSPLPSVKCRPSLPRFPAVRKSAW